MPSACVSVVATALPSVLMKIVSVASMLYRDPRDLGVVPLPNVMTRSVVSTSMVAWWPALRVIGPAAICFS